MFGLKIMRQREYKEINRLCRDLANKTQTLSSELKQKTELLDYLCKHLIDKKAVLVDVLPEWWESAADADTPPLPTYICVGPEDIAKENWEGVNHKEIIIYAISQRTLSTGIHANRLRITSTPYLQAKLDRESDSVTIVNLICDMDDGIYERKGYATMMVNQLKKMASAAGYKKITAYLSPFDAKEDKKKDTRNQFYISAGFDVKFTDAEHREGHASLLLDTVTDTTEQ